MSPNDLETELIRLGDDKAKTKAEAYMLEKAVKGVYAEQYMRARGDKSQGDASQVAYTTNEYQEAVRAAADSIDRSEAAKVRYDALMAKFEMWRSVESTKRAEMTLR